MKQANNTTSSSNKRLPHKALQEPALVQTEPRLIQLTVPDPAQPKDIEIGQDNLGSWVSWFLY